jgi:cobalt-zinc-cadmium efflux system protein
VAPSATDGSGKIWSGVPSIETVSVSVNGLETVPMRISKVSEAVPTGIVIVCPRVASSGAGMPPNQAQKAPANGGEAPPPVPQDGTSQIGVPKFVEVSGFQNVLGMPPVSKPPSTISSLQAVGLRGRSGVTAGHGTGRPAVGSFSAPGFAFCWAKAAPANAVENSVAALAGPAGSHHRQTLGPRTVSVGGVGHDHGLAPDADRRHLATALALILGLLAAEVAVGIVADSLALLSDAAHMLTDAGAIGLSLVALRLAARPAAGAMTYGFKRAEVLSAQANGALLVVLAGLIVFEAIRRLATPPEVRAWWVLATAVAGIGVNLVATRQVARANRENMAVEGSFQHLLTDLYAFAGTVAAAAVVLTTGFNRADSIASIAVAGLMLYAAYGLLRDSARVLLEGAPRGTDVAAVGAALAANEHVTDVHDLHVWEIGSGFPALSAHVLVRPGDDCHAVRRDLERVLSARFGIRHTTLQVEHAESERLLSIRSLS